MENLSFENSTVNSKERWALRVMSKYSQQSAMFTQVYVQIYNICVEKTIKCLFVR